MDTRIIIIGKHGQTRTSVVPDFKDEAQEFMSDFTTQKNLVQFAVAELVHEFALYEKTGKNQETLQEALKKAQVAVTDMNRFLCSFRHFKNGWKPYKTDPAYGIVCRSIDHYWPKFYGTPGVDGYLQIVTYYTEVTNDRNFVI